MAGVRLVASSSLGWHRLAISLFWCTSQPFGDLPMEIRILRLHMIAPIRLG